MSPKTPVFAFAASLALHAAAVTSAGVPWGGPGNGMPPDAIEIDYVQTAAPAPRPEPKKETAAAPSPKTAAKAKASKAAVAKKPAAAKPPARRKGMKPWYPSVPAAPKGGSDFLTDPAKAKVFVSYFGMVKKRIDQTVRKRYYEEFLPGGTVSLAFVLRADGALESVGVIDKQTDASADVRDFALRCLRETAPFVGFPSELDAPRIAFNVTVQLDDL